MHFQKKILDKKAFYSLVLSDVFLITLDKPPDDWMIIDCSLPVPLSLELTLTIPLASISKVTSTWGTPRGAGGIPTNWNWPRSLLSAAISRSPWWTLISTWVCPSAAVEKTCNGCKYWKSFVQNASKFLDHCAISRDIFKKFPLCKTIQRDQGSGEIKFKKVGSLQGQLIYI